MATWLTPPPSSDLKTPSLMMKPSVKPLARVRSPTTSLRLKVSPGRQHGAVDELGGPPDVGVAVVLVGVEGRELRDLLADAPPRGLGGPDVGSDRLRVDADTAVLARAGHEVEEHLDDPVAVDGGAATGRHHLGTTVHDGHRGVDRLARHRAGRGAEQLEQPLVVDLRHQLAVLDLHRQRVGELRRSEQDVLGAEAVDDRGRHRGIGEVAHRLAHLPVGQLRAGVADGELDHLAGRVRRHHRSAAASTSSRRPFSG